MESNIIIYINLYLFHQKINTIVKKSNFIKKIDQFLMNNNDKEKNI